jgi:hypothetical protein
MIAVNALGIDHPIDDRRLDVGGHDDWAYRN